MILYSLWSNIFIIRIIIIIISNKKLNSIFDTESKIIQFMGSNKYIITKMKCWPVFKQDPFFQSTNHEDCNIGDAERAFNPLWPRSNIWPKFLYFKIRRDNQKNFYEHASMSR